METAARPSVSVSYDFPVVACSQTKYPPGLWTPGTVEKVQATSVIAGGRIVCFHAAGRQREPVRAFICGATFVVSGPRSFSKTTPFRVTTKVLTPDDWYSTG